MPLKSAKLPLSKAWQRAAKSLPVRHEPFVKMFPEGLDAAPGALHTSPGFSGVLFEERGAACLIGPTRFSDGVPGTLAGEDRAYFSAEPSRRLFAMSGAGLIGASGICYVPAARTVIRETLDVWDTPLDAHPVFATPGLPPARPLPGISLSLATLGGETFYHFLIESLPKLALARAFLPHIDQLLVPRYIEESKTAWLRHLGFHQKIVWLQDLDHWHCEQLLFTNRLSRHFEPNAWTVRTLRTLAGVPEAPAAPGGSLWLDRSGVSNRATTWERDFAAGLPQLEPVDLGSLSPKEVLSHCTSARVMVGLHGAAFANMVFTPPGARIVELMPRPFHPFYSRLALACGHAHVAVRVADTSPGRADALATVRGLVSP